MKEPDWKRCTEEELWHYVAWHPECGHLFLEFPRGPVEIGDEYPVTPDEIVVEGRTICLLSPTDSVKDRLA